MSLDTVALIVMARFPEPGKVKTRLMPAISPEHAAAVHSVFLQHTVSRLARLNAPELVVCVDPPTAGRPMFQLLGDKPTRFLPQSDGDLGQRIDAAAREIGRWYGRLLFIGLDSPDVPTSHIHRAAEMLQTHEVVLGPCAGGGFWCLGMQHHVNPNLLLHGVEWYGGNERAQALAKARELDCSCVEVEAWDGVDRPEDLAALLGRLNASSAEDDRRLLAAMSFLPQGVPS